MGFHGLDLCSQERGSLLSPAVTHVWATDAVVAHSPSRERDPGAVAAPPRPAPRCAHVPGRPPSRAAARGEGWGGNQTARPPRRSRPPPGPHGDRPPRTHPRGWSGAGHDTSAHSSDPLGARAGGAALARRLRSAGSLSRARGRPGSGRRQARCRQRKPHQAPDPTSLGSDIPHQAWKPCRPRNPSPEVTPRKPTAPEALSFIGRKTGPRRVNRCQSTKVSLAQLNGDSAQLLNSATPLMS
ncbi:translation initiation factor IF-2-like [Ursus maritimus]|uniref:Translation initiation factor IF-2-like n=1 Tax=Ursus maritimus TaxID=29073 RepID=A0A8M1G2N9_URSMA|nr:translation initiation factor IF-2-like [Ursus maritimus]